MQTVKIMLTINYNNHNYELTICNTVVFIYIYIIYANKQTLSKQAHVNFVTVKNKNTNIYKLTWD